MDNKKDRQFYWEVKHFMEGNPKNVQSASSKPDLKSAVMSVIGKNQIYTQSSFDRNSNAVDIGKMAIDASAKAEKRYDPISPAHMKNKDFNSFRMINEASISSMLGKIGRGMMKPQLGMKDYLVPGIGAAMMGGAAIYGGLKAGEAISTASGADDIDAMRKRAEDVGGVVQPTKEDDIEVMRKKAEEVGGIPPSTTPTPSTPSEPKVEKPADEELERRVSSRMKARDRAAKMQKQEAKIQMARLGARDVSKMSERGRERYAETMARLKFKAEEEETPGLSDEQIRRQEQRALEIKRRTPEEKEAKRKESESVVASLAKAAEKVRAKEAIANKIEPGTRTQSASQTSPKTYRI